MKFDLVHLTTFNNLVYPHYVEHKPYFCWRIWCSFYTVYLRNSRFLEQFSVSLASSREQMFTAHRWCIHGNLDILHHSTFLGGNSPPTPPLTQHFALRDNKQKMLGKGRGRWVVSQKHLSATAAWRGDRKIGSDGEVGRGGLNLLSPVFSFLFSPRSCFFPSSSQDPSWR